MPNSVKDITESSMQNLKTLVDSSNVVGDPISLPDGTTILPISKVSFGFGVGGGDLPSSQKELFGGGTGGGVTITPLGFLLVSGGDVKLIQLKTYNNTADRVVSMVPEVMDKVQSVITDLTKGKKGKDDKDVEVEVVEIEMDENP